MQTLEIKPGSFNEVATLVPTKPEADIAAELKKELSDKLIEVCAVMDRANKAGFVVSFGLGTVPPGKNVIAQLTVAKHY
jgi:hypothetical protein